MTFIPTRMAHTSYTFGVIHLKYPFPAALSTSLLAQDPPSLRSYDDSCHIAFSRTLQTCTLRSY